MVSAKPSLVLQAYAVQNFVFWILLGIVLFRWFPPRNIRNSALWSACMFSHGLIISVRSALPDGPSMLFHAVAIVAIECNRLTLASGLVGVSGLAKDLNLLASLVLVRTGVCWRQIRVATFLRTGALVAMPLLTWIGYLRFMGHDLFGAAGISNFAFPPVGLCQQVGADSGGAHRGRLGVTGAVQLPGVGQPDNPSHRHDHLG